MYISYSSWILLKYLSSASLNIWALHSDLDFISSLRILKRFDKGSLWVQPLRDSLIYAFEEARYLKKMWLKEKHSIDILKIILRFVWSNHGLEEEATNICLSFFCMPTSFLSWSFLFLIYILWQIKAIIVKYQIF